MESIDPNAPIWTPDSNKIRSLEERLERLEDLFILHIHNVNTLLGVTDIPNTLLGVTDIPSRPSRNPALVDALYRIEDRKRKK